MIIYEAYNIQNKKRYIGKTTLSLNKRRNRHLCDARNIYTNSLFHKALRKYGKENFRWRILGECKTKKQLDICEKECISFFKTNDRIYGYNMTEGGEGCSYWTGKTIPKYVRDKIAETVSKRTGVLSNMFGKHHTKQTKEKISKAKIGKTYDDPKYDLMKKKQSEKSKGHHRTPTRKIVQLSIDDKFIKIFNSVKEIFDIYGNGSYIAVCRNHKYRRTAKGFKWMYLEDYNKLKSNK